MSASATATSSATVSLRFRSVESTAATVRSVYAARIPAVSVASNPAAAASRWAVEQIAGAERLRGLHPDQHRGQVGAVRGDQVIEPRDRDGAAHSLGGAQDRFVERRARQGPGGVVHRDDVDVACLDRRGEEGECGPLREVPGRAPGDHRDLGRLEAEVWLHRRAYGVLLAVADHQHDPHDARDLGMRCAPNARRPGRRPAAAGPC